MTTTFWRGRRVVATGGEGFIGRTLVEALLTRGAEVTMLPHTADWTAQQSARGQHRLAA